MMLTEQILRVQLENVSQAEIVAFEIHAMPDSVNEDGQRRSTRDALVHTFTVRMRNADEDGKPERAMVFRDWVENFKQVPDGEQIWQWVAIQRLRRVHGYSTAQRLIGTWPDGFYEVRTDR